MWPKWKTLNALNSPPDESHLPGELPDCRLCAAHYLVRGGAQAALAVAWRSGRLWWECCSHYTILRGGGRRRQASIRHCHNYWDRDQNYSSLHHWHSVTTLSNIYSIYGQAIDIWFLHARVQTADIYHRTLNSPDAHHKINNNKGNRLFWMHFIPKYMDYYCQHYSFG